MADEAARPPYLRTLVALLVLLAATVGVGMLPLGRFGLLAAMAVAGLKAGLVAAVFMHLDRASPVTRIFAAAGLLWLGILIGLVLADVATRTPAPVPISAASPRAPVHPGPHLDGGRTPAAVPRR